MTTKRSVLAMTGLLAAVLLATPAASGQPSAVAGFTLEISEVGGNQTNVAFDYPGERTPVPLAHVSVYLGKAGARAGSTIEICGRGPADLGAVRLRGTASNSDFRVRYTRTSDGVNITSAVVAGTYLTSRLTGGHCFRYRVDVTRTSTAVPGDRRTFTLLADPAAAGWTTLGGATHVAAYRCITC